MPRSKSVYPPEFRRRMVQLVKSGRSPESLAEEFEPSGGAIRNWVKQQDLDEGRREDGLTTGERDELRRLRRENRRLREEREILAKPRPGSLGRPTRSRRGIRVRESQSGRPRGEDDVPRTGGLRQRLLRMASARAISPKDS